MNPGDARDSFTVKHHVLLFGWMSREVVRRVGEERGGDVMREASKRYGNQRGKRMAMRARRDGRELTPVNYLTYGEWKSAKGDLGIKIVQRTPEVRCHVSRCPWETFWRDNDLLDYGKYYCQVVDEAIYHGFNPNLRLSVNSTRTNGGPYCDFVFHDLSVNMVKLVAFMVNKKRNEKRVVMPWDYHAGHLYKTTRETVVSELPQRGEEAIEAALEEFAAEFSEASVDVLKRYEGADFDSLPVP